MHNPQETQSIRITILYEKYYDRLKMYCLRSLSRNPLLTAYAEDIVQEAFEEALEKWETIAKHENLGGWLTNVCNNKMHNLWAKYNRRNKRHAFSIDDETKPSVEDRNANIARIPQKAAAAQHLEEILALLTDSEKDAVIDHHENKMTIPEMAEAYHTTEGSQKAALRRAKKKAIAYRDKNFMLIFFVLTVSILAQAK